MVTLILQCMDFIRYNCDFLLSVKKLPECTRNTEDSPLLCPDFPCLLLYFLSEDFLKVVTPDCIRDNATFSAAKTVVIQ